MNHKLLVPALLLTIGMAVPAASQAGIGVGINIGPPAAIVETPPPVPQPGYVWTPGFWTWDGARYVWVPGHYVVGRPGWRWIPEHYVQRGPYYRFVPGHWAR